MRETRVRRSEGKGRGNSFVMESKTFEIDLEEKRGKIQVAIWEKKKGISSWVRLGIDESRVPLGELRPLY
ncbi:hypothetical protein CK203_043798 [Vitis vinifera]|uniref:Uncharacterized protein n=1 Tax=Vitis vinifera TaxID=29760 RepID=A0A438HWB7_VITVI|nr:hypothetical protein CK203_043798 [Vitis vinifera]